MMIQLIDTITPANRHLVVERPAGQDDYTIIVDGLVISCDCSSDVAISLIVNIMNNTDPWRVVQCKFM